MSGVRVVSHVEVELIPDNVRAEMVFPEVPDVMEAQMMSNLVTSIDAQVRKLSFKGSTTLFSIGLHYAQIITNIHIFTFFPLSRICFFSTAFLFSFRKYFRQK